MVVLEHSIQRHAMRIRTILTIAFLITALVPSLLYAFWSYEQGVKREFGDVKDRHLLIAENLGYALDRYYVDLAAAFDSISAAMVTGQEVPRLAELMSRLEIVCIIIADATDGRVLALASPTPGETAKALSAPILEVAQAHAAPGVTTFSPVIGGPTGNNEILMIHDYGDRIAVARIGTGYFVRLGKSVAFGEQGHAAIVDRDGNVLAHPLSDWIAERRNIAGISAVQRMMAGETGIEQFYSPALKGDMISGLTAVPGPGWGVMVPQPVSEIYGKVFWSNVDILAVLAAGLTLTFITVVVFMRSLVLPLERLVRQLQSNARSRTLEHVPEQRGLFQIREVTDYERSYNHMVDEVTGTHLRLRDMAYRDAVTGLPNRARFHDLADRLVAAGIAEGRPGVLVYVDLDDFKAVNDLHGHDAGDDFLRHCGAKLDAAARAHAHEYRTDKHARPTEPPLVARIGGDEFVLLLIDVADRAEIRALLARLQSAIADVAQEMKLGVEAAASVGCSAFPHDGSTTDELLKFADIAMYVAKNAGKNRAELYSSEIGRETPAEIRSAVTRAIENGELVLEYQPQVRTSDWMPCGAEALVRWDHPERGRVSPAEWVPAIANTPVISRLGEWVVERAVKDYAAWLSDDPGFHLSVNFGARHFVTPGFADWLSETLRKADFAPERFVVEVTEDALMSSDDYAGAVLTRLHELSFSISIDDFGRGYSNLARLAELPVDQIKIDRTIVASARSDGRSLAIIRSTMAMAKELGSQTVAEGVESRDQADFVTEIGADKIQGFFFSRSLPPKDLAAWLQRARSNPVHERHRELSKAIVG